MQKHATKSVISYGVYYMNLTSMSLNIDILTVRQ